MLKKQLSGNITEAAGRPDYNLGKGKGRDEDF